MAETFAKAKMLDVKGYVEGELLAAGPLKWGPLVDGRIIVTAMMFDRHLQFLMSAKSLDYACFAASRRSLA